ncbi:hypothetical protein CPAR01_01864 [Colletotrichum paranaense]|uniref:Uncharacterized protein n=1 Tax=Colletotrichum paranaense TaxID=1914294 RepID=A0ABQ9SXY4_9PEZI|nr:uncharacterized protein CPAR01_01864 [Colletotrichum paranaense]KAK1544362.1 hypothetical protein CPAR01_01864 [Colletotrichum paranaense]
MSKPPTPRRATNPMPITVVPKRPIPLTIPPRTLMSHAKTAPLPLPLPAPLPITLVPLTIPSRHAARVRHVPRLDPPAAPLLAGMRQARPLAGARRPRVAARRLLLESAVVLAAVGRGDAVLVDVGKAPAAGRGAHAVAVAVAGGVVGVACRAGAAGQARGCGAGVGGAEGGWRGFRVRAVLVVAAVVCTVSVVGAVGVVALVCAALLDAVVWMVVRWMMEAYARVEDERWADVRYWEQYLNSLGS